MTRDFVESGFDIQHMLRTICQSRTYQQSMNTNAFNEDDTINYSHALPRRLPAEVLFDAIHQATGSPSRIGGLPVGLRAAQLPDAGVSLPFLDDFGRPPRESACECERSSGVVLGPIMKLINGPTVNDALVDPHNALAQLVASEPDDGRLIEEVFLRFLGRRPSERERELGRASLDAARDDERVARERLDAHKQKLVDQLPRWEAGLPRPVQWTVMGDLELASTAGATLQQDSSGVVSVTGTRAKDTYELRGTTSLGRLTGLRLEALPDASLPSGGPGRADNGNFVVNELQLFVQSPAEGQSPMPVAWGNPHADFSQDGWSVHAAIDGQEQSGWAVMPRFNEPHVATFETAEEVTLPANSTLLIKLVQTFHDGSHALGKFRLSITDAAPPLTGPRLPAEIAAVIATPADERTDAQHQQLKDYYFQQDAEHQRLTAVLAMATAQAKQARLTGVQDLGWALINTPAFLFNR
jgi:hypothetical protein